MKQRIKQLAVVSAMLVSPIGWASDSYNANTGVLTISKVAVGDIVYSDVTITIGTVMSVGTQAVADSYDRFDAATGYLSIPVVTVGSSIYYSVVVSVAKVLTVGSSCRGVLACTQTTPTTPTTNNSALYGTPASFAAALNNSYHDSGLVAVSSLSNRGRYLLSDAASASTAANYLAIGDTYSASTGYAVESATLPTASTNKHYLSKLLQVVADSAGYYRLNSHLHPNQAIDYDAANGNTLKFRNNFGKAATTYGYLTFAYDASTKLLQAKKRYRYSYDSTTYAATYAEDSTFTAANYYVKYSNGGYSLVAASSAATPLYFYNSPLDYSIPTNMNPAGQTMVSNSAAAFKTKTSTAATEGTNGTIYRNVNATYRSQVATPGSDAATKASADAMLQTIKTAVESKGGKLRYDTAVYTAFRDAALATVLVSDAIADGTPGQNLVPYVYYTNEQDSSGNYHPFMVVVHYANHASPHGLLDVTRPPGDGLTNSYATQSVTRYANLDNSVTLLPLKDYGTVSAVTENTYTRTLLSDLNQSISTANVYNYASTADNGLLVNGALMFPVMNNTLTPSQAMGELTANGCHVGQGGGGPHCHADGYQNGRAVGVAVYGDTDYVGKTHPPLIGFGYDGVALFGIYRSSDAALLGYSTALDSFGGHNHDSIGYHYHAHAVSNYPLQSQGVNTQYTLNVLMKGAYIGKTNSIPNFRATADFNTNKYVGGTVR